MDMCGCGGEWVCVCVCVGVDVDVDVDGGTVGMRTEVCERQGTVL
jgi:hypothetical protein